MVMGYTDLKQRLVLQGYLMKQMYILGKRVYYMVIQQDMQMLAMQKQMPRRVYCQLGRKKNRNANGAWCKSRCRKSRNRRYGRYFRNSKCLKLM